MRAALEVRAEGYAGQGLRMLALAALARQANLWVAAALSAAGVARLGVSLARRLGAIELPGWLATTVAVALALAGGSALVRAWQPAAWSRGAVADEVALPAAAVLAACAAAVALRRWGAVASARRLAWLLVACLLCLDANQAWFFQLRRPASPNVIFICIDALRPDHLGAQGYARATSPFIDRLAREGVRFARAYSQESYTLASVASFFTSTSPFTHQVLYDAPGVDALDRSFATAAELLRNAGYATAAFTFNPHLRSRYGFDQGFARYADHLEGLDPALPAYEAFETAKRLRVEVGEHARRQRGRRMFLYLHYRDVHEPYAPPPPYDHLFGPRPARPGAFVRNRFRPQDRQDMLDQYDGEIRYTDEQIALLFGDLDALGVLKDSVVVINADHGEEFWETHADDPGFWSHGRTLCEHLIRVPLILWGRALPSHGRVVDQAVGNVDILPTLLDLLALPAPPGLQGRSLLPCLRGDAACGGDVFSGGNHGRVALISGDWKYCRFNAPLQRPNERIEVFRRPQTSDAPLAYAEALYNLRDDPQERTDLSAGLPDRLREMREKAIARVAAAAQAGGRAVTPVAADTETLEQLKALGYVQ